MLSIPLALVLFSIAFYYDWFLTTRPDEIALYDRQIRLWGVKAQEKYAIIYLSI